MEQTVYVMVFASPDQVASEVFAHKADCQAAFHKMVQDIMAHYGDEPSLDMVLADGEAEGSFEDGYGISVQWSAKEVQ
ncbi:hypothetical protein [Lacticaseibacillus hulanensis]|jgi:hypothetical protein|uniref:hypothetical protein n=1 Tax=Lacticaseibacillus hulanensis TaxID=2493111 RepID=UPI000FD76574|nr:hypothetical protein [Lacticaseibacillus hulanensis]